MSKIQFRELFTTAKQHGLLRYPLCEICQRYNFESYSQLATPTRYLSEVVWDMSKIQFRELFTTTARTSRPRCRCVRYVKDTISRAIHNARTYILHVDRVVWDMSKIQFRELFTTVTQRRDRCTELCEICQRYNFESYSQQSYGKVLSLFVVWDMSKIQFRELFTTHHRSKRRPPRLCEICQRYNFESYSQHFLQSYDIKRGCVRYVKDTISRAIHNGLLLRTWLDGVVWDMSKIQFRELFTTRTVGIFLSNSLCEICQRYNFESYSQQLTDTAGRTWVVWDMSKIQFRELFTTPPLFGMEHPWLCEICQRYNFESYSQLDIAGEVRSGRCVRYVKDTISRAIHNKKRNLKISADVVWDMSKIQFRELFTTVSSPHHPDHRLCEICQRYNFESYSQLETDYGFFDMRCVRYVKDTISRAIHNGWSPSVRLPCVVWDMSKIQFRELFTTV